jgi:hypothetical protein
MFSFILVTDEWLEQTTRGATVLSSKGCGELILRLRDGKHVSIRRVSRWRSLLAVIPSVLAEWTDSGRSGKPIRRITTSGVELQSFEPAVDMSGGSGITTLEKTGRVIQKKQQARKSQSIP